MSLCTITTRQSLRHATLIRHQPAALLRISNSLSQLTSLRTPRATHKIPSSRNFTTSRPSHYLENSHYNSRKHGWNAKWDINSTTNRKPLFPRPDKPYFHYRVPGYTLSDFGIFGGRKVFLCVLLVVAGILEVMLYIKIWLKGEKPKEKKKPAVKIGNGKALVDGKP